MRQKPVSRQRSRSSKQAVEAVEAVEVISAQSVVAYDENLLERARTQWQFGDWRSLAEIDRDTIQHHPERAKLALLAAAGLLQVGSNDAARQLVRCAQDWGCNRRLIARILSAGVHNSLGRAAAIVEQHARALRHFESSIATSAIGGDIRLLGQARAREQLQQIQLAAQHQIRGAGAVEAVAVPDEVRPGNPYLMALQLRLDDSTALPLGFGTGKKQWLSILGNVLSYKTENGAPLYLVSNKDGNFEKPPQPAQIPLEPDTEYVLGCDIAHRGANTPFIWIFQYANERVIDTQSVAERNGRVSLSFRSKPETQAFAIGIRLAGEGQLHLQECRLSLDRSAAPDFAESVPDRIAAITRAQQQEIADASRQVEASRQLQDELGAGVVLMDTQESTIDPDFGVLLATLLERHAYGGVIVFGTGASTIVVAKVLDKIARRDSSPASPLLSIGHVAPDLEATLALLQRTGLAERAHCVLAPLDPVHYDCGDALREFARQLPGSARSLLVVVNGPAATAQAQRHPALSKIVGAFPEKLVIHFLLNDPLRAGERPVVARWVDELAARRLAHSRTEFDDLQKKACLVEVRPASAGDPP